MGQLLESLVALRQSIQKVVSCLGYVQINRYNGAHTEGQQEEQWEAQLRVCVCLRVSRFLNMI